MSEKKAFASRKNRLDESKMIEIDRERSLRLMTMAEKGDSKRKANRSFSRSNQSEIEVFKNKKKTLIHQIQEKLSLKDSCDFSATNDGASNSILQHRVFRLEKMMDQMKKQRAIEDRPKTVFIRERPYTQRVNNLETVTQQTQFIDSTHKTNLELILKQIHQVRQEIKQIHQANEKILTQNQPRKFSAKLNSEDYEHFKSKKESDLFSRFPSVNLNNSRPSENPHQRQINIEMEKKETLINDLEKVLPLPQSVQDSFAIESINNSHKIIATNNENPQLHYPSEVLYSWKPQETDPNMHPSRLVSSVPINRISNGIKS